MNGRPAMTPHRLAQSTRDWSAIGAYVRHVEQDSDPAVGGTVGIVVMTLVAAFLGAFLVVQL